MSEIEELAKAIHESGGTSSAWVPWDRLTDSARKDEIQIAAHLHVLGYRLVPPSHIVVPREPTEGMLRAAFDADIDVCFNHVGDDREGGPSAVWSAMLTASLTQEGET